MHANYIVMNTNEIRKFQCNRCNKSKLVLKKVADQQQHGFACDACWATIQNQNQSRYKKCSVQ